jgi:hypothetical protein
MAVDYVMTFDPQGDLLESARECEADVFSRWYGNTRAQLDEEYRSYEESSVFLTIADRDGVAVAAARLLAPGGSAGLKTLVDIGRPPWSVDGHRSAAAVGLDLSSTWEVATLGTRVGGAAVSRLSFALYHGLIAVQRANRMTSFVAVLDERVRRLLSSVGLTTRALPGTGTAPYLGSPASTPVYTHCAPVLAVQRTRFPDAHRLITLGVGLDGIAIPQPRAFGLRARQPATVGAPWAASPDVIAPLGVSTLTVGA